MSTYSPPPTEESSSTQLPHSSVVLDLAELAEKYAELVPFRMRVVNGFMAANNTKDPTFVVDEIYSVHLVKETKVVKINSINGEYSIPINSLAKFGLIHDEQNECTVFKTVDDLLSAKPLPQVVAVQNDYTSRDKNISLKKDEVLAIKDVSRSRIGRRNVTLKVFSLLSQKEIVFPKELKVKFITDPHYTQLYLTDVVDHIAMPCLARCFPTSGSSLTSLLNSMEITLQGQETQHSVIVSLFRDNPTAKKCNVTKFIDISTRININVSIIETNKADGIYQQLMDESRDLLHDYNPARICACVDGETDAAYMTQAQLLAEVRKEKEKKTLTRFVPQHYQSLIFNEAPERTYASRSMSKQSQSTNGTASKTSVNVALGREKVPIPLPSKMKPAPLLHKQQKPLPTPQVFSKQNGNSDDDSVYEEVLQTNTSPVINYETITREQPYRKNYAEKSNPRHPHQQQLEATPTRTSYVEFSPKSLHQEEVKLPPPKSIHKEEVKLLPPKSIHKEEVKLPPPKSLHKEEVKLPPPKSIHKEEVKTSVSVMAKQIKELQKSMAKIVKQMDQVLMSQSRFDAELRTLRATCEIPNGHAQPAVYIGMSLAQVLGMLDAIGLPQYKEAFSREAIDGELFAVLDDATLANELGVVSRIHRLRLLKLIK